MAGAVRGAQAADGAAGGHPGAKGAAEAVGPKEPAIGLGAPWAVTGGERWDERLLMAFDGFLLVFGWGKRRFGAVEASKNEARKAAGEAVGWALQVVDSNAFSRGRGAAHPRRVKV